MNNDFLPTGYAVPETESSYLKLKDETTTLRILSSAVIGWMYWNTDDKPIRSRTPFEGTPYNIRLEKNGQPERIKHFWAFLVWDYKSKSVKIMELTQKTLMAPIEALVKNPKWGTPKGYDITITKKGEGLNTEYSVVPEPHSESPILNVPAVNLDALFDGSDPFETVQGQSVPKVPGTTVAYPVSTGPSAFEEPTIDADA